MQPLTLLDLKIKEFKTWMQIPEYENALQTLIRQAFEQDIGISFWNRHYSKSDYTYTTGTCQLWIKREPMLGSRKEVVFDIMHEMGHCLDPIKLPLDDRYNVELRKGRELRAWAIADNTFGSFPELQVDVVVYTAYKEACLKDYLNQQAGSTGPA